MSIDEEGRWNVHFFPCGGPGCHHLNQVDITDSRAGFQALVDHMQGCMGARGWDETPRTPEQIRQAAKSCTPITEYEARHRFERPCPKTQGWNPEWHAPHTWFRPNSTSATLECYGFGNPREVPELPASCYTLT